MVHVVAVQLAVLATFTHDDMLQRVPFSAMSTLPSIRVTTRLARSLPPVEEKVIRLVLADDEVGLCIVAASPIDVMHDSVRRK